MDNQYSKVKKDILIQKLEQLEQDAIANSKKLAEFDSLKLKYDILKGARNEDKEAVLTAKKIVEDYKNKELQLVQTFKEQMKQVQQNDLEQKQTILTLFEMMDNAISQQIFYYNKFKGLFVSMNSNPVDENLKQ